MNKLISVPVLEITLIYIHTVPFPPVFINGYLIRQYQVCNQRSKVFSQLTLLKQDHNPRILLKTINSEWSRSYPEKLRISSLLSQQNSGDSTAH